MIIRIRNYKECLLKIARMMPSSGFLVNQLVCFLFYQIDRLRRALFTKEKTSTDMIAR